MVELRTLTTFRLDDLVRIMPGYTASEKYEVRHEITPDDEIIMLSLHRVVLRQPYVKQWEYNPSDAMERYARWRGRYFYEEKTR